MNIGGFELKQFKGSVKNTSGNPVNAKIEFYNLGSHDHVGNLTCDSTDGYFEVKFKNNDNYSIFISAHGYFSSYMIVGVNDSIDIHEFTMIPVEENIVMPLKNIIFDQGQHIIDVKSFAAIDNIIYFLKINPEVTIQLEGHTDYAGSKSANQDLAQRRINEVKKYILEHGIKKKRIQTKSFGGSQPLVRTRDIKERSINRRVEIRIIEIKS